MSIKCKRCNRVLKNPLSIEKGYGDTCFRIIQLQQEKEPKIEVNQELSFIKCEINMLKRMFKNIQTNGIIIDPIERIKNDNHRPERDLNKGNMANVITEMKEIFSRIKNVYEILTPIQGRTTIESPPLMEA